MGSAVLAVLAGRSARRVAVLELRPASAPFAGAQRLRRTSGVFPSPRGPTPSGDHRVTRFEQRAPTAASRRRLRRLRALPCAASSRASRSAAGPRRGRRSAARVAVRVVPRIRASREEEPGAVEVDVGHEQRHGAALGDFPGFVQVALRALGAGARAGETAQPGAGEEAAGKVVRACRRGGGRPRRRQFRTVGLSDCRSCVPGSPRRARRGPG